MFADNARQSVWSPDIGTIDPAHGSAWYLPQSQAMSDGLAKIDSDGSVYVGPNYWTDFSSTGGRHSVRLESKEKFYKGLMVARFTHLPQNQCGLWPAFWMSTPKQSWPTGGEIDIYEHWNDELYNQPAIHTGQTGQLGVCHVDTGLSTGKNINVECDNDFNYGSGCYAQDKEGPWGDANGGICKF